MSGTDTRPAPLTDAEWARNIVRRIEALERPATTRAGGWVISDRDGQLTASRADGATLDLSDEVAKTADLKAQCAALSARVVAQAGQINSLASRVAALENA